MRPATGRSNNMLIKKTLILFLVDTRRGGSA
jgi:hypothetical protein